MLHHVSFGVLDLGVAGAFYDAALRPLGYRRVFEDETAIGYGIAESAEDLFCLKQHDAATAPGPGFHLAFAAATQLEVDAFHRAALQAGGRDNGAPGLRPDYGDAYYAAFVVDPDGHRIEAVFNPMAR
ncbi:VOC family protein [Xanthomonas sp. LMG 8992]|uniref:VOC family protein n=1 Tax=Xanthomonas sp. LMG 8992 TaxID=1591157 RepID=UPI00136D005D|nr:VOC family protein [Xanthomonas sp. LMG 8992]MXV09453.1 VOC family protein [Xanthomonas sp. LMG 8992]